MKTPALPAVLALCLLLSACAGTAPAPADPPPAEVPSGSSQQVILPDPAFAQQPQESQPEAPAPEAAIPPELVAGLPREEADFLAPEQWAVYDEGVRRSVSFLLDPGWFSDADRQVPGGGPSNLPDREGYCRYTGMIYSSFTDLHRDMRTVYTEELFQRLNTSPVIHKDDAPDQPVYRDFDGKLYYRNFNGGANLTLLDGLTRYELVSREEGRVVFDQIAYFCDREDVGKEQPVPVGLCRCPVTLVLEEDGGKMAELVPVYRAQPEQ